MMLSDVIQDVVKCYLITNKKIKNINIKQISNFNKNIVISKAETTLSFSTTLCLVRISFNSKVHTINMFMSRGRKIKFRICLLQNRPIKMPYL